MIGRGITIPQLSKKEIKKVAPWKHKCKMKPLLYKLLYSIYNFHFYVIYLMEHETQMLIKIINIKFSFKIILNMKYELFNWYSEKF